MRRCAKKGVSVATLKTVSFWTFFKAKRYHVLTVRVAVRTSCFLGAIWAAILVSDYFHTHPLVTTVGGVGALRYFDRGVEVITDVICDRIWPSPEAGMLGDSQG